MCSIESKPKLDFLNKNSKDHSEKTRSCNSTKWQYRDFFSWLVWRRDGQMWVQRRGQGKWRDGGSAAGSLAVTDNGKLHKERSCFCWINVFRDSKYFLVLFFLDKNYFLLQKKTGHGGRAGGQEQPCSLDAHHSLPLFVHQTPTSFATSSWQRWRFAAMPKGTRKRRHKHIRRCLTTSQPSSASEPLPDLYNCREIMVSHHTQLVFAFLPLQHLLASHVIEHFHSVLEAIFVFLIY